MDVNTFFDNFVLKYPPYQNNRVFQILLKKFRDIFVKSTYEDIPDLLKRLYENSETPPEIYNYILTEIGVQKDLIDTLTNNEKFIFIKSLSDFQKYKGTVSLVEKVIKAYGDNTEVYELYIDYNKNYGIWECKPYVLYKPTYSESYNKTIPYSVIYDKIPSLLIHEKQLNQMLESNLAVFPIKTNVIFITNNYNQSITNVLQNLIISVFYNNFYNDIINLYFEDKLIQCSLHQFFLIWLYIVFYKTDNHINQKTPGLYIVFNRDLVTSEFSVSDLDSIIDKYELIQTSTQLDDFYNQYISPFKTELTSATSVLDKNKIEQLLLNENPLLINYIKDILSDNTINNILNNLMLSLELHKSTHIDVNFIKYFNYFKNFLPQINLLPTYSTVYKILYYLKPFHTELLDLTNSLISVSDDKFNNIYFDHIFNKTQMLFKSASVLEVDTLFNLSSKYQYIVDNLSTIDFGINNTETYNIYQIEELDIQDDFMAI